MDRAAQGARSTPLTIVSGAVAGDDLERVARAASDALGRPVAIALPALGAPVAWPAGAIASAELLALGEYAAAVVAGGSGPEPPLAEETVLVRVGEEVVGVVAAARSVNGRGGFFEEARPWLEAAAVGAAVTTLMRTAQGADHEESARALVQALRLGPPADTAALVAGARRLGCDLSGAAVAVCAAPLGGDGPVVSDFGALLAAVGDERLVGLVALERSAALVRELSCAGMRVTVSSPRADPTLLHDAVREAELLLETPPAGQEETYRLLIGVLLRNPEELELLRTQTILPLVEYDARHDTELLATLETFLTHHGSTTETAEAMNLHRHTVGYRLARSQEVSGLSPYESDGRERLSLGLKAHQILEAYKRRSQRL